MSEATQNATAASDAPEKKVKSAHHAPDSISRNFPEEFELIPEKEVFERMPPIERFQHFVLIASFFTLVATGLPLFFWDNWFTKHMFDNSMLFTLRGLAHRAAGIGLIFLSSFHVFYVMLSKQGNEHFRDVLPVPKDIYDAAHVFMYNLGLPAKWKKQGKYPELFKKYPWLAFDEAPKLPRYDFKEKFEYLALAWGNTVMICTGLMLWFVEVTLQLFPMWVLDVVKVVHGFEALLAFLAIIIWHMYNVHLNPEVFPMSKIWLNGKITRAELRHHHGEEFEKILGERKKKLEEKKN